MATGQHTPSARALGHHQQHEKARRLAGKPAPEEIRHNPMIKSTHTLRRTMEVMRLSLTTRHRPRKTRPIQTPDETPNAVLRQAINHAAPHAQITIAEQEGTITLTGTAGTIGERNGVGFACWALTSTVAVHNNVTFTSYYAPHICMSCFTDNARIRTNGTIGAPGP
ncbi:hypothetical protein IWX63_003080 [Arthrobacter sp. CAN_A2]|uniref:hypothetical protein n=1 Tax=Arthrobacter sp. CAN_A2 TaxID=2787718 RepID=UPI0018F04E79